MYLTQKDGTIPAVKPHPELVVMAEIGATILGPILADRFVNTPVAVVVFVVCLAIIAWHHWVAITSFWRAHPVRAVLLGFLIAGIACALVWYRRTTEKKDARAPVNVSMTLPTSPLSDFQISKSLLKASVKVDTKYMLQFSDGFDIMTILRVIDNSVESLDDARLSKSRAFEITGDVRTIEMSLPQDFFDRVEEAGKLGGTGGSVGLNLVLIPKSISPDQIVTLRDVTRLGGMQTTLHGLEEKLTPN